jgi:hypothetical protein
MKITAELMQKEIQAKLPSYYTTTDPRLEQGSKYGNTYDLEEGLWFSMAFTYPGLGKDRYVWVSIKEDMTAEEVDTWTTDAVIQIKASQQIIEFQQKADELLVKTSNKAVTV